MRCINNIFPQNFQKTSKKRHDLEEVFKKEGVILKEINWANEGFREMHSQKLKELSSESCTEYDQKIEIHRRIYVRSSRGII